MKYIEIKKSLKKRTDGLPVLKIAILADIPSQHLSIAIKGASIESGFVSNLFEAEYGQIEQLVLVKKSSLYKFDPDVVLIVRSFFTLHRRFQNLEIDKREKFAEDIAEEYKQTVLSLVHQSPKTTLVISNFPLFNDGVFGHFSNSTAQSFLFQLRKLNYLLMELARSDNNLRVLDLDLLTSERGLDNCLDISQHYRSDLVFDIDFLPEIAMSFSQVVRALKGDVKKCLVLDLDNTVWGGVIGDDGLTGIQLGELGDGKVFSDIQSWAKALKERGILLAVCSKNDEEVAKEPFISHPDMILKLNDISVFIANRNSKVENIKLIKNKLNISYDSMVFVDDNPFEREIIKEYLPEIVVPDLPQDSADYLTYLKKLNIFETSSLTHQDRVRTDYFVKEAQRDELMKTFESEDEFLSNLEMFCEVEKINPANIERTSQLLMRSNQFNLRTKRYSVKDLGEFINDPNNLNLTFSVKDKFGEYGLISVMLGRVQDDEVFVDSWVMSCRVLNRTVEEYCINSLVETIRKKFSSTKFIVGEYIPTKKNLMVQNLYKRLGFDKHTQGRWKLELASFTSQKNHFQQK